MVRRIILFLLVLLSLVECHWHRRYKYHHYYGYGANQFWRQHNWFPTHDNRLFHHQWNTKSYFEDSSEESPQNQHLFTNNQRTNYGYQQPEQNFPYNTKSYDIEKTLSSVPYNKEIYDYGKPQPIVPYKTEIDDYGKFQPNVPYNTEIDDYQKPQPNVPYNTEIDDYGKSQPNVPYNTEIDDYGKSQPNIPYNTEINDYGKSQPNIPYNTETDDYAKSQQNYNTGIYNANENPPEQNKPDDTLQAVVNQVIEVDKMIKNICDRGHNPSEEFTEEYYKRIFNIEGYLADTAAVRIKHTVLYSCLDPILQGTPRLEDLALLPENLIVEEAVYNIVNNNLIVKIPFKSDSIFMGGDVCRVGDIDEKIMIVSKQPVMLNYGHLIDVRNAFQDKPDTEEAIVFPDD